jgi:hypothetical protein
MVTHKLLTHGQLVIRGGLDRLNNILLKRKALSLESTEALGQLYSSMIEVFSMFHASVDAQQEKDPPPPAKKPKPCVVEWRRAPNDNLCSVNLKSRITVSRSRYPEQTPVELRTFLYKREGDTFSGFATEDDARLDAEQRFGINDLEETW